jgi:hypothetical protein
MFTLTRKEIAERMAEFIWNFKVGDNIAFNFIILFALYRQKESIEEKNRYILNKPIAIIIVSIIEAVFYDLICRLGQATTHFPESIPQDKRDLIKNKIDKERQWFAYKDSSGEVKKYKRIKNYSLKEIVNFLEQCELFGIKGSLIYAHLRDALFLRNRIHIFNWFGNYERDEFVVFNESRIEKLEDLLTEIFNIMARKYSRPFESDLGREWLQVMS